MRWRCKRADKALHGGAATKHASCILAQLALPSRKGSRDDVGKRVRHIIGRAFRGIAASLGGIIAILWRSELAKVNERQDVLTFCGE